MVIAVSVSICSSELSRFEETWRPTGEDERSKFSSGVENNSHYLLTSQTEQNLRYCTTGPAATRRGGKGGGPELSFMNLKIFCLILARPGSASPIQTKP